MENKGNEAVLTFSQYSIQIQEIQRFKTCWQCNKIQKISSKKLKNWKSSQIAKSFKIFVDFWRLKIVLELVAHIWIYGSPILSSFNSYGWMRGSLASKLFIFLFKLKTGGEVLEKVVKKMLCLKFSPSPSPWFYSGGVKWMGPLDNIGRNTSTTLRNLRQTQHTLLCWLISSENSLSFIFLASLILALYLPSSLLCRHLGFSWVFR